MDGRSPEGMMSFRGEMDPEQTGNKSEIVQKPDLNKDNKEKTDKTDNNLQDIEKIAKMFAGAFYKRERNN